MSEVQIRIGMGVLTRDIVWCECGRGISLTGKWTYCPRCGEKIDQVSYIEACNDAITNGAKPYHRDMDHDETLKALEADKARLDWREAHPKHGFGLYADGSWADGNGGSHPTYRAAIDTAMKGSAK